MARILSISSQVIYGPVGNSAATPPMLALGHEVLQLPTTLLSHHPGHGKPVGSPISDDEFESLLERVTGMTSIDAVMTGYFASITQVSITAKTIARLKRKDAPPLILIDPILGDDGKLYIDEQRAKAIRDVLLPLATIATPNLFELGWLTASTPRKREAVVAAACSLGLDEVIVTSVPDGDDLTTIHVANDHAYALRAKRLASVPRGTGDFLAGAYLAYRLKTSPHIAIRKAHQQLARVIAASGTTGILNTARIFQ
jgi:pyridoxine kinase